MNIVTRLMQSSEERRIGQAVTHYPLNELRARWAGLSAAKTGRKDD